VTWREQAHTRGQSPVATTKSDVGA
jgi:hypothetical protein